MKAVAYKTPGPIDRPDALLDVTLETPEAEGRVPALEVNVHPLAVQYAGHGRAGQAVE